MKATLLRHLGVLVLACQLVGLQAHAANWFPLGPYGGDARSFGVDPHDSKHLYLGTETGWIYQSHDGGNTWTRVTQLEGRNDLVIDHISIDPAAPEHMVLAAFMVNRPGGGIYTSDDGGKHWAKHTEMGGQSVRSLTRATSDPNILVAGSLEGVYRSKDNGKHWELISPAGSTEIHEIESVAIDPKDPNIIYAGTWHLPWKTVDGGAHWQNIKQGIIDDSDVFSIVIDPTSPNIVFASACSGIYKSVNAGLLFKGGVTVNKGQGIPASARRTRKLKLDPTKPTTVYAGTTQGLYKSTDGGTTWVRMTGADVIVNDVYVDPNQPQHVLLATDRGGVLRSEDSGVSFQSSNEGFTLRQVVAFAADQRDPAQLYVGVVNDKEVGGVFASIDGGVKWRQMSSGLGGRDVYSLTMTPEDTLLAGTSHGVFRMTNGIWTEASTFVPPPAPPAKKPVTKKGAKVAAHPAASAKKSEPKGPSPLSTAAVYALTSGSEGIYAGTSAGMWRSTDGAQGWTQLQVPQLVDGRSHRLSRKDDCGGEPDGNGDLGERRRELDKHDAARDADADWSAGDRWNRQYLDRRTGGCFLLNRPWGFLEDPAKFVCAPCGRYLLRRGEQARAGGFREWHGRLCGVAAGLQGQLLGYRLGAAVPAPGGRSPGRRNAV